MSMMLSTYAIEAMGFTPIPSGKPIEAEFFSLHIFEIRGFTMKEGGVLLQKASVAGTNYALAVGGSVNEISRIILDDTYVDNEETWAKDHQCTPPYAMILFGPTTRHAATHGHTKIEGANIVTYDAFSVAREELQRLETEALPSIEMALACVFSTDARNVQFKPIDRTVFGVTASKATVHDIRITGSATAYVSQQLSVTEVESSLKNVVDLAELLEPRVSHFFQQGLRDQDGLKRFLYFFLAIEIEVHRAFRTVSRIQHLTNGATLNARVSTSLARLLEVRDENWTNLADRFVWCVASVWMHMSDDDVVEFKRLKKIRDDIAHGNITTPEPAAVVAVEKLVQKIHS